MLGSSVLIESERALKFCFDAFFFTRTGIYPLRSKTLYVMLPGMKQRIETPR
jgi:hypothetical protein